jgi:hypothetical protein
MFRKVVENHYLKIEVFQEETAAKLSQAVIMPIPLSIFARDGDPLARMGQSARKIATSGGSASEHNTVDSGILPSILSFRVKREISQVMHRARISPCLPSSWVASRRPELAALPPSSCHRFAACFSR